MPGEEVTQVWNKPGHNGKSKKQTQRFRSTGKLTTIQKFVRDSSSLFRPARDPICYVMCLPLHMCVRAHICTFIYQASAHAHRNAPVASISFIALIVSSSIAIFLTVTQSEIFS